MSEVYASRECPDKTVYFSRLVWAVDVRITNLFFLFIGMYLNSFGQPVPEEKAEFSLISKYI